jgi:putative protease
MELVTNVPNLEQLSKCSVEPYDAVYLGNPYCWDYDGNLVSNMDDLGIAVEMLRDMGKRVYVSTFAAPRNRDLPRIFSLLDKLVELEIDAVESSNFGVMKYIKREYGMRVHAGGLANIYTSATVELLASIGIERVTPAYELSLREIEELKGNVEIEVVAHGKIPVGISHECFLLRFEEDTGIRCPSLCRREMIFESDGLILKPFGSVTLSGKDVCMYEHIEKLRNSGVDALRIEGISERIGYREKIGRIYRRRIEKGKSDDDFEKLKRLSKYGLCNGFYFNRAGQTYTGGV